MANVYDFRVTAYITCIVSCMSSVVWHGIACVKCIVWYNSMCNMYSVVKHV